MCDDDAMRVDHVSYAAEPDGVRATADRLADLLGVQARNGGVHPTYGTRNVILPMAHRRYIEVVEPLDHPATDKAPFGRAVKAACESGGGWLGWVVRCMDIEAQAARLGRTPHPGHRVFPDGRRLSWLAFGSTELLNDPQLPIMVRFDNYELHPSKAVEEEPQVSISGLTIAGDPRRVCDWLGLPAEATSSVINFTFLAPHSTPGLLSVTFDTPTTQITI